MPQSPVGTDNAVPAARVRRRLVAAATVAVVIIGGGVLWTLMDDADTSDLTEPSTTSAPPTTETSMPPTTTTWTPPPDDPTQPSPAAVTADRQFRLTAADILDCGVHVRTSGYPTTALAHPDALDCIEAAAAAGTPAQFVTTARDFTGGMEGTIFRVLGPGDILVIDYNALVDGTVDSTETSCDSISVDNFPIPECG